MQSKNNATIGNDPASAGFKIGQDGFIYYKDSPLDLPPKEHGVLRMLLCAWPEAVLKIDFAQKVWVGSMSRVSLARCMTKLRHVLADMNVAQIDSLYGRGYRLTFLSGDEMASRIVPKSIHLRLSDVAKAHPALVEACIYAQKLLLRRSQEALDQAEAVIRDVISKAPDYMTAKLILAQCIAYKVCCGGEIRRSLIDDALGLLEGVQHAAPQMSGLQSQIGHLLDCKWQFDEARLRHEQALRMYPDDAVTYFHYGLHLLATNAVIEARHAFGRAVQLNPFSPILAVMHARAIGLAGADLVDVVAQARSTHLAHPYSQQAYLYWLTVQALNDPQPEIAIAANRLMQKHPSWAFVPGQISYILARCGDSTGAVEVIAKQSTQNASVRVTHSAALVAMGRVDEAMALVKDAADLGCGPLPVLVNAFENTELRQHQEYPTVYAKIFAHLPPDN